MCCCFFQYVFSLHEMYILFPFQFVDCFHVYNLVYNSLEFILAMFFLLFQTLSKFLLKLRGIHLASAPQDGLFSLIFQTPTKYLMIAISMAILPLSATSRHSFPLAKCSLLRFLTPFPMDPCHDNPTCISCHSTLSHFRSSVS